MSPAPQLGITGTRQGLTPAQAKSVREFLLEFPSHSHLHHGDCVGADAQVAALARALAWRIISHPPSSSALRAHYPSDEVRPCKSYLARNRDIVTESQVLLVIPKENTWHSQGGTWYTHDYAVKVGVPGVIFWPSGVTSDLVQSGDAK
jgi:hypothetical protein